jgi:CO dehydrogenase/acetyl-CoA synthase delta subunit
VTVTDEASMQGDATIQIPNPVLCVSDGQCNAVQSRGRGWGDEDPWGRRDVRALQDRAGQDCLTADSSR